MAVRVVFADDQVPSESEKKNEQARTEIVRELKSKRPNIEADYEEDDLWFRGLVSYLQDREGITIITAKTIAAAENLLRRREDYDVAIIDLSWLGDPAPNSGEKKDAGLRLLRLMADDNRGSADRKPVIAFSQNFKEDLELVARVREAGTLPIQKDYSESGYRILGAAIRLLADPVQGPLLERPGVNLTAAQLCRLVVDLPLAQFWSFIGAIAAIVAIVFYLGSVFGPLAKLR